MILCEYWVTLIGTSADCLSAVVALFAFRYVIKEFKLLKKIRKAEMLSSYNERYSSDAHIERVINDLNKENSNNNKCLTTNDKEMFMRFFEELQYSIEQEGLDKEIAYNMFSYYALEVAKQKGNFVNDYEKNWEQFKSFIITMEHVREKKKTHSMKFQMFKREFKFSIENIM